VDGPRSRPGFAQTQLRDLAALGLESDGPVLWQSTRTQAYQQALHTLFERGCLYPCQCTRKDLALMASAPHAVDGLKPYPGTCSHRALEALGQEALRLRLPREAVDWEDLILGRQADNPRSLTGDPLLHRRDGCFAYHLAVVVDDAAQAVTEVVRGNDLRSVTATQIRLQEALGLTRPAYAHLGLVTAPDGSRLGKRDGALDLAVLQARGCSLPNIVGWLGWSLGCLERPEPCTATELLSGFRWERVPREDVRVPAPWT